MLYVQDNPFGLQFALQSREHIITRGSGAWQRYDNPFEQKNVLQKNAYGIEEKAMLACLHTNCMFLASGIASSVLYYDEEGLYDAIFKYDVGDSLAAHKDAERCPISHREKLITAIWYLSTDDQRGSPLELYSGEENHLEVTTVVWPKFNTLVMFDNGWHGNPHTVLHGSRLAVTCSFMGNRIDTGRERAYFVPSPGEIWNKEKIELRDLRCDPNRYAEVYRV